MIKLFKLNLKKLYISSSNTIVSLSVFFSLRKLFLKCLLKVNVGSGSTIHRKVKLFDVGKMKVGGNTTINYGCYLDNRGGLYIHNNVNISHDVKIYTMGHDVDDPMASLVSRSVEIFDDAWLFPNVLIMPGVTVGKGAVVYPGSVVTKSIPEYEVWGGNPAKFIKKRNNNIVYKAAFPVWFGI